MSDPTKPETGKTAPIVHQEATEGTNQEVVTSETLSLRYDNDLVRESLHELLDGAKQTLDGRLSDVQPPEVELLTKVMEEHPEAPSGVSIAGPSRYPGPVLLVGSGANIGYELARRLIGDGATVILTYHSNPAPAVQLQLANPERVLACLALDVRAEVTIQRFFQELSTTTPSLYAVVNTIGPMLYRPLDELTAEDVELMAQTNYVQAFSIAQKAKPLFLAQGQGRLVHFTHAGVEQLRGYRYMGGYSPAKAALLSLSRSLAIAWARQGITVNTIGPGIVETAVEEYGNLLAKIPQRRLTTVDDLYRTLLFFLDPQNDHVTGNNVDVSGGFGIG